MIHRKYFLWRPSMVFSFILSLLLFFNHLPSQNFLLPSDTLNKNRVTLIHLTNATLFTGTMIGLNSIWYSQYPRSGFHFFNDNGEWNQMDKMSHSFAAYNEAYWSSKMYQWSGMSQRKSMMMGCIVSTAMQLTVETLDGFSKQWGFSIGDLAANTFGAGLLFGQELLWKQQKWLLKASYSRRNYPETLLNQRADQLFGASYTERLVKDYNAQTYWLSINLATTLKLNSKFPSWLNLAVGYGADNLFGAVNNSFTLNGKAYNRNDLMRYRQFYLAPDIDFSRIKTKSHFLKTIFYALNIIKFPTPAVEFNTLHRNKFHWLFF